MESNFVCIRLFFNTNQRGENKSPWKRECSDKDRRRTDSARTEQRVESEPMCRDHRSFARLPWQAYRPQTLPRAPRRRSLHSSKLND